MALDLKRKLARLAPPPGAPPRSAAPAAAMGAAESGAPEAITAELIATEEDPAALERRARIERVRGMIAALETRGRMELRAAGPRAPRVLSALPGETIETAHGPLHRVAQFLQPGHCHGRVPIARALQVPGAHVAALALDPGLASIDLRGMWLLDTETTGLSGGTGTLPFLIGMAWFEDESLKIEQLFLRRPGEERPMLARLAERIAASSCIVTYNGKSFDWPLLRTRAVMNRIAVPTPAAHLDLLHCARRVFARRLGQVRLVQIETEVLGMRRERDVDGAEIPELYWDFVRGHEGSVMAPVIEHNANDLVALAGLLATLAERWADALPGHAPADRLGIAKTALRHGDLDRAMRFAQAAASGGGPSDVTVDALLVATEVERERCVRGGRHGIFASHGEIARLLREALEAAEGDRERASAIHLALAKHLEHRGRDPDAALAHAQRTASIEGDDACAKRVSRLLRKRERRVEKEEKRATREAARAARPLRASRGSPRP